MFDPSHKDPHWGVGSWRAINKIPALARKTAKI
jgi:hypothetical protein